MRSLRGRLLASNVLIIGMIAIMMIGAAVTFYSLGQKFDSVLARNFPSMLAAHRMQQGLQQDERALELAAEGKLGEAHDAVVMAEKTLNEAVRLAMTGAASGEELNLVAALEKNTVGLTAETIAIAKKQKVTDQDLSRVRSQISFVSQQAELLFRMNQNEVLAANTRTQLAARDAFIRSVFITVMSLVVSALLSYRIMKIALQPLAIIAKQAKDLVGGAGEVKFEAAHKDEVGALADSLNEMAENLSELRKSEVRRLRRAQLMSYAALESLHDPVIVTDAKQRIINLNRAAEGLFGPVPETPRIPVAQHIKDTRIINSIDRLFLNPNLPPPAEGEQTKLRVAETQRTYLLRTSLMRDDERHVLGSVTVLEDITHLKHLDQLKTEFIGVASHELKTPIASLVLNAQFLAEGGGGPLTDQQKELVELQLVDLERLQWLSKELLDLTKLEAGTTPPRFERVAPADLVATAFRDVMGQAKNKSLDLSAIGLDVLPMIRADRSQMVRVLVNLISNAIRHTHPTGLVQVTGAITGDDVTLRVRDNGEGIPEDYLPRIFERFVQVPGATSGSAGLGLAIVQNIVRLHGGEISVESKQGEGTTFSFTVPQSTVRETPTSSPVESS